MRIVLSPVGGADEVFPMIVLGEYLRDHGHAVSICAPEKFRALIMKHNLRMVSSGATFESFLESGKAIAGRDSAFAHALAAEVPVHFVSMRDALREADLLIGSVLQFAGPSLAEQIGIPYMTAITSPLWLSEQQFPAAGTITEGGILSGWRRLQRARAWNDLVLTAINRERRFSGLQAVDSLFKYCTERGYQILGVDPELTALADGENRTVTGFWNPTRDSVSADWSDYFNEGKPVVFIGPLDLEDAGSLTASMEAVGFRALFSADWNENQTVPATARVYPYHSDVPPEASIILHKGSSRFTAAAARAAVPQAVVPLLNTETYWAEAIHRCGAGPEPIKDAAMIPEVIHAMKNDAKFTEAARVLAQKINSRDSLASALSLIESRTAASK